MRSSASTDLVLLLLQLPLVRQDLPGRAGVRGARLDAVRGRLEQLGHARLAIAPLALDDARPDAVAGNRAVHEQDVAARAGDSASAVRERLDDQVELLADGRARGCFGAESGDLCWQAVDVNDYRAEAEEFLSAIDREYYLHFAGLKDEYEIEPIYARHARLFSRETVEALREGDNRVLLKFAAEGYVEQAVKELSAELARLEASLEVQLDGDTYPFRQAAVVQANERDPARRRALEHARNELVETRLNPLLREMFDRSRELVRELGWPSVRAMTEELSGIDLGALAQQTEAFLAATERSYEDTVEPRLRAELDLGFDELERRRPRVLLPRAVTRRAVPARSGCCRATRRRSPASASGTAGRRQGDPRRRAAAEEVTARVLRARARARRGVPRAHAHRRPRGLRHAPARGRPRRALLPRGRRRFRSSTAGWATTR